MFECVVSCPSEAFGWVWLQCWSCFWIVIAQAMHCFRLEACLAHTCEARVNLHRHSLKAELALSSCLPLRNTS